MKTHAKVQTDGDALAQFSVISMLIYIIM